MDPATIALLVGSKLFDYFTRPGEQNTQVPLYGQQQNQAMNQLLQQGLSGLSGGPGGYENAARANFEQKTIPTIAERFAGRGDSGALNRALAQGARGLETDIAANRSQDLFKMLNIGLTPQFQQRFHQPGPGIGQEFAGLPLQLMMLSKLFGEGNDQGTEQAPASSFTGSIGNNPFQKPWGVDALKESGGWFRPENVLGGNF